MDFTMILILIGFLLTGWILVYPFAYLRGYEKGLEKSSNIWQKRLPKFGSNPKSATAEIKLEEKSPRF